MTDIVCVSMLARPTAATLATKKHLSLVAARLELPAEPSLRALVRQPEEMVALMAEKAGDRVTTEELRALVDELAAVAPAPGDDEAEAERKHSLRNEIKARLPAWVPCSINGGWRSAEHFVSRQIIGLESDAMPGATWDDVVGLVRAKLPGLFHVVHTSATERNADGTWRIRVYVVLDRPVTSKSEWDTRVKPWILRTFGDEQDEGALDCVRLFYLPVRTSGYQHVAVDGARLRLDDLPTAPATPPAGAQSPAPVAPDQTAATQDTARRAESQVEPEWLSAISQQRREEAAANYVKGIPYEGSVDGSGQLIKLAAVVCCGFACGEEGGFRVLRAAPFAERHKDDQIRRRISEAMRGGRVEWGCKFEAEKLNARVDGLGGTVAEPRPGRLSAADRARRVGGRDVARLKTGLPTLDDATRGGILVRKVAVIGGAPGAGKTALLMRLAHQCLIQGIPVGVLAGDEDADGLLIRLGQQQGLARGALENGDPDAREALAAWCEGVPLILADGDEDDGTIESLSRDLRAKAGDGPAVLVVDSVQTVRTTVAVPKGADVRARINATMQALKRAAKVDGHLVVASSEISKAAYRNQDQAENLNPLAAFKESGDIEYGVSLAIVLTSKIGTSELVDAAVVKNRLGPSKPRFMLKLDHDRADVNEATVAEMKTKDPLYFTKVEIMAVVEQAVGVPLTKGQIFERVGGKRNTVWRAIDELLEARELHQERTGRVRALLPGDPGPATPIAA